MTVIPLAVFSEDGRYRYALSRDLSSLESSGTVAFIGLNPSTADATNDDPTIRQCVGFARRWGFARLLMLNLYAYRSTDPRVLRDVDDPVGPGNDPAIRELAPAASLVICAWGIHGDRQRATDVLELLVDVPHCLGLTKHGAPRHPLYMPRDARPFPYTVAA